MTKSNVIHALLGIVLQLALYIVTWNPWYGFALVVGLFWGREQTQKQYYIAKAKRCALNELEWYEGCYMVKWSKDSLRDFFAPFVATLVIALAITYA